MGIGVIKGEKIMNVALYARVSTEDQNVDQQVEYLKQWCKKQCYHIERIVKDNESGRLNLNERKCFKRLLDKSLNDGFDAIVIYNLDRLTRNWDDVTFIEKHFRENWGRCKLISTSDSIDLSTSSGRLMFRLKMAVSCFMPEDMREKQRIGIERAKRQGKYKGRKKGSKNKGKYRRNRK